MLKQLSALTTCLATFLTGLLLLSANSSMAADNITKTWAIAEFGEPLFRRFKALLLVGTRQERQTQSGGCSMYE